MRSWMLRAWLLAALSSWACTNDYDAFSFTDDAGPATGGIGGTDAGSGGNAGTGGNGGTISLGGTAGTAGSAGTGGSAGCAANQKLCAGQCVASDDPKFGCGASACDPCAIANASTQCFNGQCALLTCDTGFGDCANGLSDGCEQNLDTTAHCGACDHACSTDHSTAQTCASGDCQHECETGFGDCSTPISGTDDGCEADLSSEVQHCGSCANNCAAQGASGGFTCTAARCGCTGDTQCEVGGGVTGSCESSTGLCSCDGTACVSGEACVKKQGNNVCSCNGGDACAAGMVCCQTPAGCKDLDTDAENCGGCGHACPTGQTCSAGQCQ